MQRQQYRGANVVKMVGFKVKKGHESWERHFFDDHNIFPVFFWMDRHSFYKRMAMQDWKNIIVSDSDLELKLLLPKLLR